MIPTIWARSAEVALHLLAAQIEPAVAQTERLVDAFLVELERERRGTSTRSRARSTCSSTSPVGIAALTVLGRARDDLALAPGERTRCGSPCAGAAAAGERSGLTTSWQKTGAVAQVDEDETAVVAIARTFFYIFIFSDLASPAFIEPSE